MVPASGAALVMADGQVATRDGNGPRRPVPRDLMLSKSVENPGWIRHRWAGPRPERPGAEGTTSGVLRLWSQWPLVDQCQGSLGRLYKP
jgi:hypothetical protein